MDKKAHTPGPWYLINGWQPWENAIEIAADDNRGPVCFTATRDGGDPAHADARLIAAAPDLLKALEGLVSKFEEMNPMRSADYHTNCDCLRCKFDAAKAAISKATGGE